MDHTPRYRNDLWTLADDLGLGRAGDQAARMALEVEPPFTLGITGKWGAGKTSVLRRAFVTLGGLPIRQALQFDDAGLEEDDDEWSKIVWDSEDRRRQLDWPKDYYPRLHGTLCVWYSPWQHQNEPNPLIPLIREIQAQFEARLTAPQRGIKKIKSAAKAINRRGGLAAAKLLEQVADAAASVVTGRPVSMARGLTEGIQKAWREAEPDLTAPSDGQRFHLLFEDAINEVLTTLRESFSGEAVKPIAEHARLILFIDDLDRCEEEVIVRLLEAIKLYLSSKRCVFVLGLDDGAVLDALGRHWKRSDDNNREYLEKLFQATLSVPLPHGIKVMGAVARQLESHDIAPDLAAVMAQDIESLLEPNPRKIKNFANGLCAAWGLLNPIRSTDSTEEEREGDARRFVMYHYLRLYHRPVWRLLERQPETLRILWRTLNKKASPTEGLGLTHLDEPDQRLLREVFSRTFAHVLPEVARDFDPVTLKDKDDPLRHRNQGIEDAVKSFLERQDRKRSDEYFVRMFNQLETIPRNLPDVYLYLPEALDARV